jgi:hypothetical protein
MTLDLSSSRAKLDRAHEHLRVLHAETAAFYEGNPNEGQPYKVGSEYRANSCQYVFTIKVLREPPPLLGLLLGDYAHNLRAALDHLVCQLALAAGGTCDTTQFPICSTHSNFVEKEGTWLKGIDNLSHRATIEKLQPYHSGEAERDSHFLNVIAWLDNTDKHRVIHPTFGYLHPSEIGGAKGLRFVPNRDAGPIQWHLVANGRRIEGDTDIVHLGLDPLGPKPRVHMHGDLSFEPAFGDRWLPATALPHLARCVKDTLALFS